MNNIWRENVTGLTAHNSINATAYTYISHAGDTEMFTDEPNF